MALDYLSIPGEPFVQACRIACGLMKLATSVDVERVFSQGRLLLSHTRSRLSAQSIRCLLCLSSWATLGLIKDTDIKASATLPELDGGESDIEMPTGWDAIVEKL
jgi:hypothetical protein